MVSSLPCLPRRRAVGHRSPWVAPWGGWHGREVVKTTPAQQAAPNAERSFKCQRYLTTFEKHGAGGDHLLMQGAVALKQATPTVSSSLSLALLVKV